MFSSTDAEREKSSRRRNSAHSWRAISRNAVRSSVWSRPASRTTPSVGFAGSVFCRRCSSASTRSMTCNTKGR